MNPLKKLAGQTAIYGLSTIVGRLLNYFLVPLYTYTVSASAFGVYTELYAYSSFLLIILTYGMETALLNFSAKEENEDNVYSTSLISILISSIAFIGLIYLFVKPLANAISYQDHPEYLVWFALIIAFDAVSSIVFVKLRQQNKAKRFAFVKIINILTNIAFNVFFMLFCFQKYRQPDSLFYDFVQSIYDPSIGIGYAFIANLIASGITILMLLPELSKVKWTFDSVLWKKMIWYAFPILIAGLAGMINETMDRILLKYLLPKEIALSQVGIYGACYKISIIMTVFIQTFRYAAEPFFFSHAKEKGSKEMYADVMKYFVIICSVIFLGTMCNLSWIQYFVGKEFRAGLAVVPILLLANLCLGVATNLSIWYKLTNKTKYGAYLTIYGAIITLILNFYWIPKIGYLGSAWATLICYASIMILSYFIGKRHFPINYDLIKIAGYFGISLFLYFLTIFIQIKTTTLQLIVNNFILLTFIAFVLFVERRIFKRLAKTE